MRNCWSLLLFTIALPLQAMASEQALSDSTAATRTALAARGIVDVTELAPGVLVALKYAVAQNFMGVAVYGPHSQCYLQREAAEKLARAQALLEQRRPGLRLLMRDCLRPRAVQRRMWGFVAGTPMQSYVARPDPGSMHNHGAAVDISLADAAGNALDMGTPVDHFGPLAQPRFEARYLRSGELNAEQVANRRLLREVMLAAGWRGINNEWWHFEAFPVAEIRRRFPLVETLPSGTPEGELAVGHELPAGG